MKSAVELKTQRNKLHKLKIKIMSVFGMSDRGKKEILDKHKEATKSHYVKKDELKQGVKIPEKTNNEKPSK